MSDGAANDRMSLAQVIREQFNGQVARCMVWRQDHKEVHEKMDKRITEMEKLVTPIKVIIWVGAGLGISIIGLVWSLITGQVQLIFR